MASAQLQLIHTDHTWKLDRNTVQVGRAGIAQARAALAAATKETGGEGQLFSYSVGRADDPTDAPARREPTRREPTKRGPGRRGHHGPKDGKNGHRAAA